MSAAAPYGCTRFDASRTDGPSDRPIRMGTAERALLELEGTLLELYEVLASGKQGSIEVP